jgi:L-lactate dehydrogenase (cytochrome)
MRLMDSYADQEKMGRLPSTAHVGYLLRAAPDWDYVAALREGWDGSLILKGVTEPEVAARAEAEGWTPSGSRTMPGASSTARPRASTS